LELEQAQHQRFSQRLTQRLWLIIRYRYIEAVEVYFGGLALSRAVLLYRAPAEFSIFAFYAPLVGRAQFVLWLLDGLILLSCPFVRSAFFRVPVMIVTIGLWFFSAFILATNSASPLIALPSFWNAGFIFWVLLAIATRLPSRA
jgi:hypothetical protein